MSFARESSYLFTVYSLLCMHINEAWSVIMCNFIGQVWSVTHPWVHSSMLFTFCHWEWNAFNLNGRKFWYDSPVTKKPCVTQQFKIEFPVIQLSTINDPHAYCSVSVKDIRKHIGIAKHQNIKAARLFVAAKCMTVIQEEMLFIEIIVECRLPLWLSDHAAALLWRMFPLNMHLQWLISTDRWNL